MSSLPHPAEATVFDQWRQPRGAAPLAEVHRSVVLPQGSWRRFAAFLGPGYMVAVGYMDPGNWATSTRW